LGVSDGAPEVSRKVDRERFSQISLTQWGCSTPQASRQLRMALREGNFGTAYHHRLRTKS
jgi:hypothetical protein